MKSARFAASLLIVGAVLAFYHLVIGVNNTTVALSLLLAILWISARWGLAQATAASIAATVGFNFYFLPPLRRFTIDDPQNWVALGAFLATAVTASQLSDQARRRAADAEAGRLEIERLYALVQAMILSGNPLKTIRELINRIVQVFGCGAAAFYYLPADEIFRTGPESNVISDHDLRVAAEFEDLSLDRGRAAAVAPVRLGMRPLGSVALAGRLPSEQTIRAIVNLAAITIEKARALEDASHAEAARQSEVLKSALLDSLAHDIKTPLTSIKAAVTALLGSNAPPDRELLTIIDEEADRLNSLAAEVVEMARIEAGKLHLEKRTITAAELIDSALSELHAALKDRPVEVRLSDGVPAAEADPEFIGQALKQILENALKYSPEGSPLTLSAAASGERIVIGVGDRGPGIEEDERSRVFDKFFRGRQHRFETKGTGMGLSIAKGIVEAHGERIWVESEPGRGSVFYFSLPASKGGAA